MAVKKPNVRKLITESKAALREIMRENLAEIAGSMTAQIAGRAERLQDAQVLKAIKDVATPGLNDYKATLKTALAVIALDAIDGARKEVPNAKNVKLAEREGNIQFAEFDQLPLKIQRWITAHADLMTTTQVADLEKALFFQFMSSVDSTDDMAVLEKDLESAAEDFILGASIEGGASASASQAIAESRKAFFMSDDVKSEIDAFVFNNGDPVSPICQDLAGTVFGKDDPEADRYYPPLHFNAVLEGTLIETMEGLKPVEQIAVDDMVRTHTGQFHRVYDTMSKFEDKEYLVIRSECGKELHLTGEHPVLTARGWVRADELILGDDLICTENLQNSSNVGWIMSKLVAIERRVISTERLFNLAVRCDESFIANGVVVHNCKSYVTPILAGLLGSREIEDLKPSNASLDKYVQFSEHHTCECGRD